jgi:branched-chain amino acid transport system substrate-binding protein
LQGVKVDTQGLTGGAIEMSANDHYGPTYWRLYRWENGKLDAIGGWQREQALAFPAQ